MTTASMVSRTTGRPYPNDRISEDPELQKVFNRGFAKGKREVNTAYQTGVNDGANQAHYQRDITAPLQQQSAFQAGLNQGHSNVAGHTNLLMTDANHRIANAAAWGYQEGLKSRRVLNRPTVSSSVLKITDSSSATPTLPTSSPTGTSPQAPIIVSSSSQQRTAKVSGIRATARSTAAKEAGSPASPNRRRSSASRKRSPLRADSTISKP
jgi:hypothetical protein